MIVAICDDNQQDIERIRRYTLRLIDYAVEYVFYTRPEELLRECADAEQKPDMYILDIDLKHVHSVSSGMVMFTDGTELGVTRGYRKELTEKHLAFV